MPVPGLLSQAGPYPSHGGERFDYIVIGAGSAGCVVAARLSENPSNRVLLMEAGPKPQSFWLKAPAGLAMVFHDPRFNWRFETAPIPSLGGRSVYWPRGKTLGGSSAINGMVYRRGHPGDYDRWVQMGNPGWGWDDVLPLFRKSEANERGESPYRGGEGEMAVSDPVIHHPSTTDFVAAAVSQGIEQIPDLNEPPHEGVSYQQFHIRKGVRETSYTAFIKPHLSRPNLEVRTDALVCRVIVHEGRATGVEIERHGRREIVSANCEIVLSAGAVGSPHVLNLSGIGGGAGLREAGLDVIHDLAGVGANLQDHWNAPFTWRVTGDSSYNRALIGWRKYMAGAHYLLTHDGYLAMGTSAVSAYVRSSPEMPTPDLQLAIRPMTSTFLSDGSVQVDPEPGISGATVLVGPRSRGTIKAVSADPRQAPEIQPNYLSDPSDIERLLGGIRLMRKIAGAEPMRDRIVRELTPGPEATSDEALVEHMKSGGGTSWHPVGTCRMGPDAAAGAVVDTRLRVHGIAGLRVADASIMPRITSGNTHAPSVMIGEKAAIMIVEDASAGVGRPARSLAAGNASIQ